MMCHTMFALLLAMLVGPVSTASAQDATPGPSDAVFTAEAGWSVRLDFAFWYQDEAIFEENAISLWAPDIGTLGVYTVDADFTLPRGLSGEPLTYTDTRECLPWVNSSFKDLMPATDEDGAPLRYESETQTSAVYLSGVDDQTVFYTECRMLVPGESYVWILASTPTPERYNVMLPEIVAISTSLTIPGVGATPGAD